VGTPPQKGHRVPRTGIEAGTRQPDRTPHSGRGPVRGRGRRDVEAVVLATLIDAHPAEITESEVRRQLTSIEKTPERMAVIDQAVESLIEVGLVVRAIDLLRPTPAALRAGELELGL
jgi:hypothetical protein